MDALVLGCTHYPLLRHVLAGVLPEVQIIDMAEYAVRAAKDCLTENDMMNKSGVSPQYHLHATSYADKLKQMAKTVLQGAVVFD